MRRVKTSVPLLAALLAIPGAVAAIPASAEEPPPLAVETFAYPDAAKILAEQSLTLKTGDGNIKLADCASESGLVRVVRQVATPAEVCFKVTGPSGYLAVETANVINIKGDSHAIKATLSTDGATSSVDIAKNTWTPVGEADNHTGNKPAMLLELLAGDGPAAPTPTPEFPAVGALAIGVPGRAGSRGCTGTLVDPQWVLTSIGCIADPFRPNADLPIFNQGTPATRTTFTVGGHTVDVAEFGTHTDRKAVLARLAAPVTDVTPLKIAANAPANGDTLKAAGFGRNATSWWNTAPRTTTQTVGTLSATDIDLAPAAGAAPICAGDTGAPLVNAAGTISGIVSRAWQGGCAGTASAQNGARAIRADGLGSWLQEARATDPGWKASVLVNGDNGALYRAVRLADGSTTDFTDIQARTGASGGVKAFAQTGINNETHLVTLGNDGHLWHSALRAERPWPGVVLSTSPRTDLTGSGRTLAGITAVSAVSIGWDLHVVVVADGKVYHTMRDANGTWSGWGDVQTVAGSIGTVTTVAIANVGNELQVVAVAGGKAYHTIRAAGGTWSGWGDVAQAAGATGPISGVTIAGAGSDAHIAVLVDNGARQFHTIRRADRTWQPFADLAGVWGGLTATSISASTVDSQVQFTVTTGDNRLLWTARRTDATWAEVTALNLAGTTGTHNRSAVTAYVI
ncbi:trypsin-like serine protease [Kitasatospora griseola]|uniref:trypsin-like serine protease n=1 Tax=Kitasatospora griseola TaxID=2064 RepID=UPI00365CED19